MISPIYRRVVVLAGLALAGCASPLSEVDLGDASFDASLPPGRLASPCATDADCPSAQGSVCRYGRCGCPPLQTVCGPPPGSCADLRWDADHCGTCGTQCYPFQSCDGGACG
ncbi:MAG: hypothetical protein ACYCWW_04940 [Deltaproteobacteria bacterium]